MVVDDDHAALARGRSGCSVVALIRSPRGVVGRWSWRAAPRCPRPGAVRTAAVPPCRRIRSTMLLRTPEPVLGHGGSGRSPRPGRGRTPRGVRPRPRRRRRPGRRPECLAALTIASRAASTSGRSRSETGRVADGDHLDRDAVAVLDLGGRRLQGARHRRVGRRLLAVQPGRAGRAPGRGPGWRPSRRRRRASGSARASAAPSRAGARPCRRAPGTAPGRRAPRTGRRSAGTATARPSARGRPTPSTPATTTSRATPTWPDCRSAARTAPGPRASSPTPAASRGVRRDAAAADHGPDEVDAGRCCPPTARAAPRRPAATARPARPRPSSTGQNTTEPPTAVCASTTTPSATAPSATSGPTSCRRRPRRGACPAGWPPRGPGVVCSRWVSVGRISQSPAYTATPEAADRRSSRNAART